MKEKLHAEFGEGMTVIIYPVSSGKTPVEPYFYIPIPGTYELEFDRLLKPPLAELKKAWARLSQAERDAFIAGHEAAMIPDIKECPF